MPVYFSLSWLDIGQWQDDPPIPCSPVCPLPGGFFPEGETVYQTGEEQLSLLFTLIRERMERDTDAVAFLSFPDGNRLNRRIWNMDEGFPPVLRPGDGLILTRLGETLLEVNRWIEANGFRFFLLSLSMLENRPALRFLCPYTPQQLPDDADERHPTFRQASLGHIAMDTQFPCLPTSLTVDGQEIRMNSGRTSLLSGEHAGPAIRLLLDYLRQENRLPDGLPENNLVLSDHLYFSEEGEPPFPEPPYHSLKLSFPATRRETPLEFPFTAQLGEQDDALVWRDADGQEHTLYIEGLQLENPYDEEAEHAGDPRYEAYFRGLEEHLPREQRFLVLAYERTDEEKGISLRFELSAKLDQVPVPSDGGAIGWICGATHHLGPHGYPLHLHALGPVSADFSGPVEMELFSVSRELPPVEDLILL